jgi:hypothetical protein
MSNLALLLVVALCSDGEADKVCSYMDITQRMEVSSDQQCFELAEMRNAELAGTPGTPRYACITRAQFLTLLGDTETVKPTATARQL